MSLRELVYDANRWEKTGITHDSEQCRKIDSGANRMSLHKLACCERPIRWRIPRLRIRSRTLLLILRSLSSDFNTVPTINSHMNEVGHCLIWSFSRPLAQNIVFWRCHNISKLLTIQDHTRSNLRENLKFLVLQESFLIYLTLKGQTQRSCIRFNWSLSFLLSNVFYPSTCYSLVKM